MNVMSVPILAFIFCQKITLQKCQLGRFINAVKNPLVQSEIWYFPVNALPSFDV
jgi:hypothetical protein